MGEAVEMTDHVVGEIQCGEGAEMFETLHVIRVREEEGNGQFFHYSQPFNPVVVKVETLQFPQMIHS